MLGILSETLRMFWVVAGLIGVVELTRFTQHVYRPLRRPWAQGLSLGITVALTVGLLLRVLHAADLKEIVLIVPFLGMVSGVEGSLVGAVVLSAIVPQQAPLLLVTEVGVALLIRLRQSPIYALGVAWAGIGLEGPLFQVLHGSILHPAGDLALSAAGALGLVAYVREVDRKRHELLWAERRATIDALTGLLNRKGLEEYLQVANPPTGATVMIDLDDFKPINEIYGHDGGDVVLQVAAERLRSCLRPSDALSRLGGDEFVAVLPGADREAGVALALRMLEVLHQDDIIVCGDRLKMNASFGVAVGCLTRSLTLADKALLRAKADGKSRIRVHGEAANRDEAEGQLLRVTSFARELLFGFQEGVVVTGTTRRIVAASSNYIHFTGERQENLIDAKPHSVIGTEITDRTVFDSMLQSLDRDGSWRGELVNRRPSGEIWWANWSMRAVDVRDHRLGYVGIVRDVTAEHRQQADLLAEAVGVLCERYDPSLSAHLDRTGYYMEMLVAAWQERHGRSELNLNPKEYAIAAKLHDVGKLSVDRNILLKPGLLTPEERAEVNRHAEAGYLYLSGLCQRWCDGPSSDYMPIFLRLAMDIALNHHERIDGTGYPYGRKGREIPLVARLFSVIDVYDALCSSRPYKHAWDPEDAYRYLVEARGTAFDEEAVDVLSTLRFTEAWVALERSREKV